MLPSICARRPSTSDQRNAIAFDSETLDAVQLRLRGESQARVDAATVAVQVRARSS
jgi:hypothetical protein